VFAVIRAVLSGAGGKWPRVGSRRSLAALMLRLFAESGKGIKMARLERNVVRISILAALLFIAAVIISTQPILNVWTSFFFD
jgi:hypothetical protein